MKWQEFEDKGVEFLREIISKDNIRVVPKGKSNSTTLDVEIKKNKSLLLNIEIKKSSSQIGQFVVEKDEENKKFVLSKRLKNHDLTRSKKILDFLNLNYSSFKNITTSGQEIECDQNIKEDSIINFINSKNIHYIISHNKNYEIKIIHKSNFFKFFKVTKCVIRKKGSGSSNLNSKVYDIVAKNLKKKFEIKSIIKNRKTEVLFKKDYSSILRRRKDRYFYANNENYYLSPNKKKENSYFVKKTSKTKNPSVIFSLKFLENDFDDDRKMFEKEINI